MKDSPRILKILTAVALLWANLFLCNFAQASGDINYSAIGWWQIIYREVGALTGCQATAQFQDQTTIKLALIQEGTDKKWVVYISNPKWASWLGKKRQHTLWVVAIDPQKPWKAPWFVSDDKGSLYISARIEFINSLADAKALAIYDENQRLLIASPLSMKDSESAIRSVVNCVREHPPRSAPAPETQTTTEAQTFSGTAFFVAPNILVTNNHVVKECRSGIQVRYPDRRWYTATMSGQDETNDLALLHTDMENLSVASFRLQSRVGESVAVFGFPYAGLLSSRGNFTMGIIAALSGMNDDSRFIQISAQVQPGNSGGPLLDMSGSVIGVVSSQLNAIKMMQVGGNVPQDVNFAIHGPLVVNFLSARGETPKSDSSAVHRDLPSADVADLAQKFTVQVYCQAAPAKISQVTPSTPPESTNTALERQAKEFVLSIQDRWSGPNTVALAGLDALYENEVMYYGKMTKKGVVIKEKQAFVRKFPEREYKPREPIFVQCYDNRICIAHGLLDFRAVDPVAKVLSEGVATFEYQFILSGTTLKISLENGEVKSRTRTPLSDSNAAYQYGATWKSGGGTSHPPDRAKQNSLQ
jgi:S1-C subfamily serine protease